MSKSSLSLKSLLNALFSRLENSSDPFPAALPEKPPQGLFAFIWYYTQPFWKLVLLSSIFAAVIALIEVGLFAFVGDLVDWVASSDRATFWTSHQKTLIGMGVLVLIILPLLKFSHEALIHQGLLGNFAMRTRWQAHRYLLRQSIQFFENDFAGRVATKMMQTALGVRETVLKITEVLVYVSVYFVGAVVLFASSDWRLTAPMLLWLAAYYLILRHFIPRLRDVSQQQADARSGVTGRIVDSYTNISTVKMFAQSDYEDQYARAGMGVFMDSVHQQMRLVTLLSSTLSLINSLLLFSVCALSLWLWTIGAVTGGAIAFATGLVLRLQGMSQWILWEVAGLFENIGVVQDGIGTLAHDRAIIDQANAHDLAVTEGDIQFDRIHFDYGQISEGEKQKVLHDFSLHIAAGEKIGVVGRSGAGKSTLVNLLLRFYDIESGQLRIDGHNIAEVTQESLRAQIGMVTQDTSLLHRSVTDNIRYGNPEASEDDIVQAAKQAHAHTFILDLQDPSGRSGYAAHVGERGVKLSGGQRQRIAIARVLLKNAPILVLDEATSALDSEVEVAIQESLAELMQNKTVIAIAHRLSTIAMLDRLVVMDQGQIIEQGSHEQLINKGGLYAALWAHQSGGFLALGDTSYE